MTNAFKTPWRLFEDPENNLIRIFDTSNNRVGTYYKLPSQAFEDLVAKQTKHIETINEIGSTNPGVDNKTFLAIFIEKNNHEKVLQQA